MAEIYHEDIVRHAIIWKTNKEEFSNCQPRSIHFLGSKWNVECVVKKKAENYRIVLQEANNIGKSNVAILSFCATTYLKWNYRAFLATVKSVQNARRILWEFNEDEISDCMPAFNGNDAFEIVCRFDVLKPKTETISSFGLIPMPEIKISPTLETPVVKPGEASVELPPDLESLSLDLCNLLEDKDFPDVQLRCGDRAISAHRAILAARSEVFAAMFRNKMTESETGVVDVTDLDGRVLETLLSYVYAGKFPPLSDDLLPEMYAAGDKYAVHPLKKACSDRMAGSMTQENCLSILKLANAHSDRGLEEAAVNYVVDHIELLKSDAWSEFNKEQPILALTVYKIVVEKKCFAATASK